MALSVADLKTKLVLAQAEVSSLSNNLLEELRKVETRQHSFQQDIVQSRKSRPCKSVVKSHDQSDAITARARQNVPGADVMPGSPDSSRPSDAMTAMRDTMTSRSGTRSNSVSRRLSPRSTQVKRISKRQVSIVYRSRDSATPSAASDSSPHSGASVDVLLGNHASPSVYGFSTASEVPSAYGPSSIGYPSEYGYVDWHSGYQWPSPVSPACYGYDGYAYANPYGGYRSDTNAGYSLPENFQRPGVHTQVSQVHPEFVQAGMSRMAQPGYVHPQISRMAQPEFAPTEVSNVTAQPEFFAGIASKVERPEFVRAQVFNTAAQPEFAHAAVPSMATQVEGSVVHPEFGHAQVSNLAAYQHDAAYPGKPKSEIGLVGTGATSAAAPFPSGDYAVSGLLDSVAPRQPSSGETAPLAVACGDAAAHGPALGAPVSVSPQSPYGLADARTAVTPFASPPAGPGEPSSRPAGQALIGFDALPDASFPAPTQPNIDLAAQAGASATASAAAGARPAAAANTSLPGDQAARTIDAPASQQAPETGAATPTGQTSDTLRLPPSESADSGPLGGQLPAPNCLPARRDAAGRPATTVVSGRQPPVLASVGQLVDPSGSAVSPAAQRQCPAPETLMGSGATDARIANGLQTYVAPPIVNSRVCAAPVAPESATCNAATSSSCSTRHSPGGDDIKRCAPPNDSNKRLLLDLVTNIRSVVRNGRARSTENLSQSATEESNYNILQRQRKAPLGASGSPGSILWPIELRRKELRDRLASAKRQIRYAADEDQGLRGSATAQLPGPYCAAASREILKRGGGELRSTLAAQPRGWQDAPQEVRSVSPRRESLISQRDGSIAQAHPSASPIYGADPSLLADLELRETHHAAYPAGRDTAPLRPHPGSDLLAPAPYAAQEISSIQNQLVSIREEIGYTTRLLASSELAGIKQNLCDLRCEVSLASQLVEDSVLSRTGGTADLPDSAPGGKPPSGEAPLSNRSEVSQFTTRATGRTELGKRPLAPKPNCPPAGRPLEISALAVTGGDSQPPVSAHLYQHLGVPEHRSSPSSCYAAPVGPTLSSAVDGSEYPWREQYESAEPAVLSVKSHQHFVRDCVIHTPPTAPEFPGNNQEYSAPTHTRYLPPGQTHAQPAVTDPQVTRGIEKRALVAPTAPALTTSPEYLQFTRACAPTTLVSATSQPLSRLIDEGSSRVFPAGPVRGPGVREPQAPATSETTTRYFPAQSHCTDSEVRAVDVNFAANASRGCAPEGPTPLVEVLGPVQPQVESKHPARAESGVAIALVRPSGKTESPVGRVTLQGEEAAKKSLRYGGLNGARQIDGLQDGRISPSCPRAKNTHHDSLSPRPWLENQRGNSLIPDHRATSQRFHSLNPDPRATSQRFHSLSLDPWATSQRVNSLSPEPRQRENAFHFRTMLARRNSDQPLHSSRDSMQTPRLPSARQNSYSRPSGSDSAVQLDSTRTSNPTPRAQSYGRASAICYSRMESDGVAYPRAKSVGRYSVDRDSRESAIRGPNALVPPQLDKNFGVRALLPPRLD